MSTKNTIFAHDQKYIDESIRPRFAAKYVIASNGCWLWTGGTKNEYAALQLKTKHVRAHRISYELHYGRIGEGLEVRHTCDNPLCVNPKHLVLGTHQDNMMDMVTRGRAKSGMHGVFGDANPHTKISTARLKQMCERRRGGATLRLLAREYGVSESFVSTAYRGLRRVNS